MMIENILIRLQELFLDSSLSGLIISYLAGLAISFSPCAYPLIPITLGVIGAASTSTRSKGFFLSLAFTLGIALVYTVLGIISSLLGIILSSFFVNPVTYLALGVVFLLAAGFYSGLLKLRFAAFRQKTVSNKQGLAAVFVLGMISALAIIPCNFPVLGAILALISSKQNLIYAALCLFLFSIGYGTLFIVLGTFSSLIRRLPKQGFWLIIVKSILVLIFILIGVYFILKFIILIR